MKKLFLIAILLTCAGLSNAQNILTGTITDESSNDPLVGANIRVKDSSSGTVTDINGYFKLEYKESPFEMIVSYVGYESKIITISDEFDISIHLTSDYKLQEVVINAIRGNEIIPVTAYTLRKQNIDKIQIGQDALYILDQLSPSIISYSESGTNISNYGQMRLRGIDQTRINITLDGAPLNDMIDQGVFFSNFIDFSNSVQSIQVQRGVGTSTNGTASYAGSINFESMELHNSPREAELQVSAGSFGSIMSNASLKTGLLKNKTAFYTRFSKINSKGYRKHTSTDAYSFFFSGGYYGKKDLIKLTAFTGQSQNGLAYLPVALDDIRQDPKTNYVNENDIDNFGQDFAQLQYTRLINNNASWVSSLYYGGAGGDFPAGFYVTDSIYNPSDPDSYELRDSFVQINYPLTNRHYGFTSYYHLNSADNKLNLNTGIHLYTFKRINQENVVPDSSNPYYEEHSRKNELSLFAKSDYSVGHISLYGDLQFRNINLEIDPDDFLLPNEPTIQKTYTFINPKIGITYQLDSKKNFYFLYGFSGREPTKIDLIGGFQLNEFNLSSVISDDVKPEYVNDFEAGFRMNGKVLTGQVNLFYMKFSNEIAPIGAYVPEGFIQLRKNIPSSFRTGIEFDWRWIISNRFSFIGNATFMDCKIDTYAPEEDSNVYKNVSQPLSPKFMGNASFLYSLKNLMEFELGSKFMGESFLEPTNQPELIMPGFIIMNARIGIKFLKVHEVNLFANNIMNTQYFTYGAPVDPAYDGNTVPGYFVQPPRNFLVSLKLRF